MKRRRLSSKRLLLTLLFPLFSFTAHAQELLSPAKYYVYKVVWERVKAYELPARRIGAWDVNMIFLTGPDGGQIYQTVKGDKGFTTVGTPAYFFSYTKHANRSFESGISYDPYDIEYEGEIIPPTTEIQDPRSVSMVWESYVTGEKVMTIWWDNDYKVFDEDGEPALVQNGYRLVFYCALFE